MDKKTLEKMLEDAYRDGYCRGFANGNAGRQWKLSEGPLLTAWGDFKHRNAVAIQGAWEPDPATTKPAREEPDSRPPLVDVSDADWEYGQW